MAKRITKATDLKPGDYYEDCSYHPCICMSVNPGEREVTIFGISLVDGSTPRSCSLPGCAVRKLTLDEAMVWKFFGPADYELPDSKKWHLQGERRWVIPKWIREAHERMEKARPGPKPDAQLKPTSSRRLRLDGKPQPGKQPGDSQRRQVAK